MVTEDDLFCLDLSKADQALKDLTGGGIPLATIESVEIQTNPATFMPDDVRDVTLHTRVVATPNESSSLLSPEGFCRYPATHGPTLTH